jgi:hypothetical protein
MFRSALRTRFPPVGTMADRRGNVHAPSRSHVRTRHRSRRCVGRCRDGSSGSSGTWAAPPRTTRGWPGSVSGFVKVIEPLHSPKNVSVSQPARSMGLYRGMH